MYDLAPSLTLNYQCLSDIFLKAHHTSIVLAGYTWDPSYNEATFQRSAKIRQKLDLYNQALADTGISVVACVQFSSSTGIGFSQLLETITKACIESDVKNKIIKLPDGKSFQRPATRPKSLFPQAQFKILSWRFRVRRRLEPPDHYHDVSKNYKQTKY